jgi:LAS superfamily LD-carboxypeptidase LdcB
MSWQIFKDNIVKMSDNPDAIPDIDTVAKTYAREYDAAIKRGKDTIEGVSLQKGNVEIMEALFKAALQKGLTSTTPYDLVGEMGKGVLAYWGGAVMNNFPTPKTPATGAVSNISVTSNVVMNPGQWNPPIASAAESRVLPDDPMIDPANIGDDSTKVEEEFVLDSIGPDDGSAMFEMESRQPKNEKIEEITLIENPEEITIVGASGITITTEEVIRIEATSDEYTGGQRPNENNNNKKNNNNWDDGNKTPVRIYSNVGSKAYPVPPGYEKYSIERTTVRENGKTDGPGGNVPYEALGKFAGGHYAHPEAAKFMNLLLAAAKKDGITIDISSSYRDYATGIRLWNDNEKAGTRGNAATPGHSAHGFGGAIDVGSICYAQKAAAKKAGVPTTKGDTAAGYVRQHSSLYAWLAANAPKYGWYNPARLNAGMGTQEAWHWEYWGFYTLSKEERAASGASVAPSGGVIQSTNKQKGSDKSNSTGAYITYNMNLAGPVAFVFSGTPSSTLGAKYMDTLIPDSIKKTKKLVISDWENLKLNKFLTDFPNVKISSISGWSKAGEFIIPNIASYLKSGYFVGLMDPSVTQKFTQKENANLKMIYKPTNWSTSNGIAFGTNLASFGKSMGASAQLTNLGHSAIPAEFFKQFGNRL